MGWTGIRHASSNTFCKEKFPRWIECLLLVDAEKAFNKLNRKFSLQNIKWLCPLIYTYTIATLYLENGAYILLQEGVTQGDNATVAMYAISTRPLMQALSTETANNDVKQVWWFADDSSAVWSLEGIKNGGTTERPRSQSLRTAQSPQNHPHNKKRGSMKLCTKT